MLSDTNQMIAMAARWLAQNVTDVQLRNNALQPWINIVII
jgi:hypothetical protein